MKKIVVVLFVAFLWMPTVIHTNETNNAIYVSPPLVSESWELGYERQLSQHWSWRVNGLAIVRDGSNEGIWQSDEFGGGGGLRLWSRRGLRGWFVGLDSQLMRVKVGAGFSIFTSLNSTSTVYQAEKYGWAVLLGTEAGYQWIIWKHFVVNSAVQYKRSFSSLEVTAVGGGSSDTRKYKRSWLRPRLSLGYAF